MSVVHLPLASAIVFGENADVDQTAEQLSATSTALRDGVWVQALSTNSGTLYIGGSGVTTSTGYPLAAGASVFVPIDDLSKIYAIGSADNQAVRWIGG